jgi:hypothetical protein
VSLYEKELRCRLERLGDWPVSEVDRGVVSMWLSPETASA